MIRFAGCRIEPLNSEACHAVLEWVAGKAEPAHEGDKFKWMLAHCHDGVTWGRWDGSSRSWVLSSKPFPDLCPHITTSNLLEIRLFGPEKETLIWRTGKGFSGRCLIEEPSGRCLIDEPLQDKDLPCRPDDETRILLGERLLDGPKDGFTRVGTAGGAQQAVPWECTESDFTNKRWPLRLKVRHYFEHVKDTGAVREAASRLVKVCWDKEVG
ncbi:MAG TPA: CRISPR-associated protein Csx19 [bacterium]|nr:CRISPR-associated protein Csx19 [bacterium]